MNNNITIWLTSCWRYNLLKKTILSLSKNINLSNYKKIIVEDSKNNNHINKIKKSNKNGFLKWWKIIFTKWIKQHWALKELYKNVDSKYIFHCEDDWYFEKVNFDFFKISINILENNKDIWIIQLRNFLKDGWLNTNNKNENDRYNELFSNKIIEESNIKFVYFRNDENWDWCKWFSYNPWMRRTDEMKKIMFWYEEFVDEFSIGKRFNDLWLKWINLQNWIVTHIWNNYLSTKFTTLFDEWFIKWFIKAVKWSLKYRFWLLIKLIKWK